MMRSRRCGFAGRQADGFLQADQQLHPGHVDRGHLVTQHFFNRVFCAGRNGRIERGRQHARSSGDGCTVEFSHTTGQMAPGNATDEETLLAVSVERRGGSCARS